MISLAFEDKECARNRTMWHEMEPGMKTARKSLQLCILLCKKYFNLKIFALYGIRTQDPYVKFPSLYRLPYGS